MAKVIHERREEHGFLLTAWVFLPDHWHAIFYPPYPLTISTVMESIKGGATKGINHSRREAGLLFQPRFFDRALRTVKERVAQRYAYVAFRCGSSSGIDLSRE